MDREVSKFLKSNDKILIIPYKGSKANAVTPLRSSTRMALTYLVFWFASRFLYWELKNRVYRLFGVKIGKGTVIAPDAVIDPLYPELIAIGEGSIIGWGVKLFTHEITIQYNRLGRITIGKQVVIGIGSTIRSGVTIGDNSIVAMCSFVNKDVPPNTLVGGVPARIIKNL